MKFIKDKHNNTQTYLDWYEIVGIYNDIAQNPTKKRFKGRVLRDHISSWQEGGYFYDAKMSDMVDRIRNGYEFDHRAAPASLPNVEYDRPRMRYTDDPEGEYSHDLYITGETEHFLTKPKRKSVGGLRLRIQFNFSCGIGKDMIAEYTQWVGTVIQSLQARGYDLEIELYSEANGVYTNTRKDGHYIRVSKFGERVMPHSWSAAFSPGGFRHFMFLAYMWPEESEPVTACGSLGMPLGRKYDITWEPKERIINIETNSHSENFPIDDMTKRFESWTE
jgi:hypothetical protein